MKNYPLITVTFNPAVDKSTSVPFLLAEKKLRCTRPVLEPGGGGINVARAIKKLGGEALALYLAGGYNGNLLGRLLEKEGVAAVAIPVRNDTRENLVVLDSNANRQYRFGMPGPEITKPEWEACLQAIEEAGTPEYIVASGSLAPGVPTDIFARVACIAQRKQAKLVVDTSGEALRCALEQGVYLIKPNLGELASLAGRRVLDEESAMAVAKNIVKKGQAQVVAVSMGPAGALLITDSVTRYIHAPAVQKKSTIGAGDSMVAGIIFSLLAGRDIAGAAEYGVACGTAAAMNAGTGLCRREDVESIFRMITITPHSEQLQRAL